jgi:DNA-binding CsgD family transcriptional regulator
MTAPISVSVIHPEAMSAQAIAWALERYPGLVVVGTGSTAMDGRRLALQSDAVVVHRAVPGAGTLARSLASDGTAVVELGDGKRPGGSGCIVPVGASIRDLVSALRPGADLPERSLPRLTHRERQVLTLVAGGLAGKQVARKLGISPKTVERHKTRIYSKLGVPNQAAAARFVAGDAFDGGGPAWSLSST